MLLLLAVATAAPLEARALAGALVEVQSHGEVDLGLRSGPWSATLHTDTLDLRWSPEAARGRATVGLRGEALVAGLMPTPWGPLGPDPDRALFASYVGPDLGAARYLPAGLWVGAGGRAHLWAFGATPTTTVPVPGPHLVAGVHGEAGWWRREASVLLRGGVDGVAPLGEPGTDAGAWGLEGPVGEAVAPWADAELRWRPRWIVAPRAEARLGTSDGRGAALAYRVGGTMPYGVPLAGHGWARYLARDYVAARLGVYVGSPDAAPGSGVGAEPVDVPADGRPRARLGVYADGVALREAAGRVDPDDGVRHATVPVGGLAVAGGLRVRRGWVVAEGGWGLGTGLQGLAATTLMVRAGLDWSPIGKRAPPSPAEPSG